MCLFSLSIKSSNLYCCPNHSSIRRLWFFAAVVAAFDFFVSDSAILKLNRLQITGKRSTASYRIINFIPVTHILRERERDIECVLVLKA